MTLGYRRNVGAAAALLAVAVLAIYGQVYTHGFINYDDPKYVSENPIVLRGLTLDGMRWAFTTGEMGNWHPLTWLSHMLDVQLFGPNPGEHHLVNVAFHLANTLLLFRVLQRMTRAAWPSLVVAALFGVHPLHVESVAWIAERKDVLSTFGLFLTLWAYSHYAEGRAGRWYAVTLICFALGLMAKPMLVTTPFALLLLDIWPLRRLTLPGGAASGPGGPVHRATGEEREGNARDRRQRRGDQHRSAPRVPARDESPAATPLRTLLSEKVPFLGLTIIASAVAYTMQSRSGATDQSGRLAVGARLANALVALIRYLIEALWPVDLAVIYPYDANLPLWQPVAAALCLAVISIMVLRLARRQPYALIGWLWYLGTLVPVIGLVQIGSQALADRYTYVPLIGVFVIVAWGGRSLAAHWDLSAAVVAVVATGAIGAYGVLAWEQVQLWTSSETLLSHAVRVTRGNCIAHNNLGIALAAEGKTDAAVAQYQAALQIKPDYADAYTNLGLVLVQQGHREAAAEQYRRALRYALPASDPHTQELVFALHTDLGRVLSELGQYEEAIGHLSEAARLESESVEAHNNLGNTLRDSGRLPAAIEQYEHALRLKPDSPEVLYNLGTTLAQAGQLQDAIDHFQRALRLRPDYPEAHHNMGSALFEAGQFEAAIEEYQRALRLKPDYAQAQHDLEIAMARRPNATDPTGVGGADSAPAP